MAGHRVLLLIVLWIALRTSSGAETFCTIEKRKLTCQFPDDLKSTRKSFCLNRYNQVGKGIPVGCNWADEDLICTLEDKFSKPEVSSHTFTLDLPPDAHGTYTCSTIPPDKDVNELPCHFVPSSGSVSEDKVWLPVVVIIVVLVFICILLLTTAGLVLGILIDRRRKKKRNKQQSVQASASASERGESPEQVSMGERQHAQKDNCNTSNVETATPLIRGDPNSELQA